MLFNYFVANITFVFYCCENLTLFPTIYQEIPQPPVIHWTSILRVIHTKKTHDCFIIYNSIHFSYFYIDRIVSDNNNTILLVFVLFRWKKKFRFHNWIPIWRYNCIYYWYWNLSFSSNVVRTNNAKKRTKKWKKTSQIGLIRYEMSVLSFNF